MATVNSLNNVNLTVSKKGTIIEDLTETLDFNDDVFDLQLVGGDYPDVLVTINPIELRKKLFNRVAISSDYTTQSNDIYIAVDTTSAVTITLHDGYEGEKLYIKDETGNAKFRPITVLGDIDIDNEIKMQVQFIGLQFIYTNGQWVIV